MKSDVRDNYVQDEPQVHRPKASHQMMKPSILKNLVNEVKETVATEVAFEKEEKSSFGLVDMWNIRKHGRYAGKPRQKGTIVTGISY
jgi:hypothetical protein